MSCFVPAASAPTDTTEIKRKECELTFLPHFSSSVIRQKGESQNGYFKKTKHAKFSEKRTFLTR